MNKILILIPPSEGKQPNGHSNPLKKVEEPARSMVSKINEYEGEWGKVLGVKDKALEKALDANKKILSSKTLPAIERYTGVVYNAIGYPSFSKESKNFFDQHVRIVSALWGLVKPTDLIPDYKLKIDKLGADKYWLPINREILKNVFVIDLLPKAHKKAVAFDSGVSVDFIVTKNGKSVPAGHQGKHIKGRFIRWLAQQQSCDPKMFKEFKEEGFQWCGEKFVKVS